MENRPHVIAITEIKPKVVKDTIAASEFNLPGYDCYCIGLEEPSMRGLLFYVETDLAVSLVDMPTVFSECNFIEVNVAKGKKFLIGNIYRSPSSTAENDENLFKLLEYINTKYNIPTLLVGDFNFGAIKWESDITCFDGLSQKEIKFIKSITENCLYQHATQPTRQRGQDTPHTLDLILSSDSFVSDIEYNSPLGMSDHAVLTFSCCVEVKKCIRSSKFSFDRGNYSSLREYLSRDGEIYSHKSRI